MSKVWKYILISLVFHIFGYYLVTNSITSNFSAGGISVLLGDQVMVEIIGQESSHSADINAPYPAETTIEESKKNKNTVKAVDTDQNQSSSGVNKSKQGLELKRVGAQSVSNSKAQFYSPIIPIYPAISKQLGEQGRVVLAVFIDTSGFVYKTEVKSSSGHVRLDNQAQKTVLGIKVKPAVKNGEPESSVLHIGLDFKLN